MRSECGLGPSLRRALTWGGVLLSFQSTILYILIFHLDSYYNPKFIVLFLFFRMRKLRFRVAWWLVRGHILNQDVNLGMLDSRLRFFLCPLLFPFGLCQGKLVLAHNPNLSCPSSPICNLVKLIWLQRTRTRTLRKKGDMSGQNEPVGCVCVWEIWCLVLGDEGGAVRGRRPKSVGALNRLINLSTLSNQCPHSVH